MTCDEFLRLLDADDGWREGEAAAHAASCPACGAEARRMELAAAAFAAMREDPAPPFLHTRVMARVREAGAAPPWWKLQGLLRPAWVAPLLLVGIVGLLTWQSFGPKLLPARAPVPQRELAAPREVAADQHAPLGDTRIQTPPVDLPVLGGAPEPKAPAPSPSFEEKALREEESPAKKEADVLSSEVGAAGRHNEPPAATAPEAVPAEVQDSDAGPAGAKGKAAGGILSTQSGAPAPEGSRAQAPGTSQTMQPASQMQARAEAESRKKLGTESGLAAAEAPKEYILVDLVDCTLRAEDGVEYVSLNLPDLQAPPPGVQWAVTVKRNGIVEVRDESGNWLKEATAALQAKAPSLNLLPGRYRLGRGR